MNSWPLRIGSLSLISADRVDFDDSVRERDLQRLARKHPDLSVIQSSHAVNPRSWRLVDKHLLSQRPDVAFRAYGYYGQSLDLSLVRSLPHVRHFHVDVHDAHNVEYLAELDGLEGLGLALFNATDFNVLASIPTSLTSLSIGATRSKKPDLSVLDRFRHLRTLFIEGQSKNIEVLTGLRALEDVTLRSVTTDDLNYLAPHEELWSLKLKLGGIKSLEGILGKTSLKYLELWQIQGFTAVDAISSLGGLQSLFLHSLPNTDSMPDLTANEHLRRVVLMNLKSMSDFGALEYAPALEEFALIEGSPQQPEQLRPVLRNSTLRRAMAGFGSDRRNREFEKLLDEHGIQRWEGWSYPFDFRWS